MLGFAVSGGLGRRGHQQAPPTGQTISAPTVTRRTARVELTRSQLVQERSLLARPTLSSYGNFLARSARTGPTSGTRASGRVDPFAALSANDRCLRIPAIGSAPGGNSFTALLFGRLYGRRIKLYRGIHLRRAVPSFTVELRRRPRLATNSGQNPSLSVTKILQAPFERGSHRVAAAAFETNASTSPANVAAQATGRILQCLVPDEPPRVSPEKSCSQSHRRI